ncbi:Chaperone protein [Wickerhamomyces ciferrii]|uniref:Chaperone protein n=1 Tax=Wickerhamomyces ciferrii (strain ATCC 14091 / BCRC 22168 / CBS 111 / JCM 3599 / NBRC 0793 / NRRL Y-1031 F-60-10) TaxID=1206466 RepID=K0KMN3_WICCF|nr:Chaperone protein [Wickerhamomyces ciferrii]CCH42629.1 Chaperone protein [Wickerhamomyces ciferrii]
MSREYTKDQEIIVEKILKHKGHEYYKILEIEKTATDNEIKKAYRKISLKVHPDKNSHPKAADCFKIVNKAFEVLGDSQKRTIYDQTGSDPDQRGGFPSGASTSGFSSAGGSPFGPGGPFGGGVFNGGSPFGGAGAQGFQFDNDLFDILFGNAQGTTFSFGGGPAQTFTFSSNGSPFMNGGGFPRQRRRAGGPGFNQQQTANTQAGPQAPEDLFGTLKQLLPLFAVLIIPLISNFFSDSSTNIQFQLEKSGLFSQQRISDRFNVPYYVTPKQSKMLKDNEKVSKKLDKEAESYYVGILKTKCNREQSFKEDRINDAYGWFFHDEEKLAQAEALRLPACEKLSTFGLL